MAKEIAIGKRAKISQAQQYMLLAVLGASLFLGAGISLTSHFIQQISFNSKVIAAEEQSIARYSDTIKNIGICKSPSGSVYSDSELESCDPASIEVSEIPDSLRANILEKLAANEALNSVPRESDSGCIDSDGKPYTYRELNKEYQEAEGSDALQAASNKIKKCSALRIIPDALPSFQNEEALLSSLNKLFIISNAEPESFTPNAQELTEDDADSSIANILPVSFSLEDTNTETVTTLLRNIERSIREFNVKHMRLEWGDSLNFQAEATAYYIDESTVNETTQTITAEGN